LAARVKKIFAMQDFSTPRARPDDAVAEPYPPLPQPVQNLFDFAAGC
jgi:hypothetical protein